MIDPVVLERQRTQAEAPPLNKVRPPAPGRCMRRGCTKKVRCKGLCAPHYFQEHRRLRETKA